MSRENVLYIQYMYWRTLAFGLSHILKQDSHKLPRENVPLYTVHTE
jgi:hypothetical protein